MNSKFFKDYKKDFFKNFISEKPISYTIVIIYMDRSKSEQHCIDNPWAYMKELKKNPNIKNCYIKDE